MKRLLLKITLCFCLLPLSLSVKAQWVVDNFKPGFDDEINSILVQPDGKILVGGSFIKVGGQNRGYLVRFNTDGSLDSAFNPIVNERVSAIVLQANNKILIGGSFTNVNGQARKYFARLNADGTLDSLNQELNGWVKTIAVQTDGKIFVGGQFTKAGTSQRKYLARLNTDGSLDQFVADKLDKLSQYDAPDYPSPPNGANVVNKIILSDNGAVIIHGIFTATPTDSKLVLSNAAYLNSNGKVITPYWIVKPGMESDAIHSIIPQNNNKYIVSGRFRGINEKNLIRVDETGNTDDSFTTDLYGSANQTIVLPDGKILIGGGVISNDLSMMNLIRINSDGKIDKTFNAPAINTPVTAMALQTDGRILVAGLFRGFNDGDRCHLVRLYNKDNYTASFVSRWKSDQTINIQSSADNKGKLQSSAIPTSNKLAQWEFIRVAGTNFYRIRNVAIPTRFLNIEKGALEASEVPEAFLSGHWELEKVVEGTNEFYRIKSRWKSDNYINIEKGTLESSAVPAAFYSGMWKMN